MGYQPHRSLNASTNASPRPRSASGLLNAPGKFLISAPEHDTPRRARAYLVTDETVTETATRHAPLRPRLDEVSRQAMEERSDSPTYAAAAMPDAEAADTDETDSGAPDALLWAMLSRAPAEGIPVADLVAVTGMSHRWVNYRLKALADVGRAVQIKRGVWRPTEPGSDAP
jgi:S-DNA-T family DNA segregation ATPase FtsK/SpoIIIE